MWQGTERGVPEQGAGGPVGAAAAERLSRERWELPSGCGRVMTDAVTGWEGTRAVQPGLEGRIPYSRALTDQNLLFTFQYES